MPRSASTWSFNVIMGLLRRCFPDEPVFGGYSTQPVEFLKSAPVEARHVVMKSHWLTPFGRALVRTGAVKAVATWRDPADALASWFEIFGGNFEEIVANFGISIRLNRFLQSTGGTTLVTYDEVVERPREAIARIGKYLAGDLAVAEIVEDIAEETSFERMRERVARISAAPEQDLVRSGPNAYDPQTLLHRNHIRNGGQGYGRVFFTPEQLRHIEKMVRDAEAE
jgi:hypothetical protein